MALYAISDLHLSLSGEKPMDVFSDVWKDHQQKIEDNWREIVRDSDTVLMAGDLSWSLRMDSGKQDLDYLSGLPGRKILIKGNHDYWWKGITKLNSMYPDIDFIQNNSFLWDGYAVCGSRGWMIPGSATFDEENDRKIFERELIRMRLSLESAKRVADNGIIAMIHYPPTNETFQDSAFTDLFEEYCVEKVIYGHLHGNALKRVMEGTRKGVEYILTSCDHIGFRPVLIKE
ncbi:metallophosphoesterase [Youngiibacter multivorans]|uniref:Phosphohydrolase n=1 Tax=Youngiibacter multivorans TaxID=937251 RepID=A0ABS4G5H1_9CLOT|nr:metallophosphoesterase [Youngiibacter multivorans]MBP1919803.1 putative phosphohydrolase [Youngiibacter multivorans]